MSTPPVASDHSPFPHARTPRRHRRHQLHVWLDGHETELLAALAAHFRESGSFVVRRLILTASKKLSERANGTSAVDTSPIARS